MAKRKVKENKIRMTDEQVDPSRREIIFYEEENPRCVVNMLPDTVKAACKAISPELLSLSLTEIRKRADPSDLDEQMRLAFWDEYFIATDNDRFMRMDAVYSRICSREYFYRYFIREEVRLAYMLRPPEEYILKVRALLDMGLNRFSEILNLPLRDLEGKVDSKLIGQIVHIVTLLDNRVRGAVPQKVYIEGRQVNMNMNYQVPKTHEEIQQELIDIEKEIYELSGPKVAGELFDKSEEGIAYDSIGASEETLDAQAQTIGSGEKPEEYRASASTPIR
jgi:hypothetical protein